SNKNEIENKNKIQEIFPTTLLSDNIVKKSIKRVSQQGLKSGLDRLSLEALKMLCKEEGLLETEVKKELIKRLAVSIFNKPKGKAVESSNYSRVSSKKKNIGIKEEKSLEKTVQATMIVVEEIRRSVQSERNKEEDKYWPKEKLDLIAKARDVAAIRAFMLKVANKERWNIAAGFRYLLEDNPMEVYFQKRLANTRELAKNK
ncbi:24609_t:CDS:2, partial [Cetraspora pellucida]